MCILKWLTNLTSNLFATAKRPIFLIVNKTNSDDYADCICHLLAVLGGDVVCFTKNFSEEKLKGDCFDGIIYVTEIFEEIEIIYAKMPIKNSQKTHKKRFSKNSFNTLSFFNLV